AEMEQVTGVSMPSYPNTPLLHGSNNPDFAVSGLTWSEARAYCRFMGKELPTTAQWQKGVRGGLRLPDGAANTSPRRNLPWGGPGSRRMAKLGDVEPPGNVPVGSFSGDVSPYGVLDLAGSVQEWTSSVIDLAGKPARGFRTTRGGNFIDANATN